MDKCANSRGVEHSLIVIIRLACISAFEDEASTFRFVRKTEMAYAKNDDR